MYCTAAYIKDKLPIVTDDMTDPAIETFIEQADAKIDGRLKGIYTVPFVATFPKLIVRISTMLTLAWIKMERQEDYEETEAKKYTPYQMEKSAIRLLEDIAIGRTDLDGVERISEASEDSEAGGINVRNIPQDSEDEIETVKVRKSNFYLPQDEELLDD